MCQCDMRVVQITPYGTQRYVVFVVPLCVSVCPSIYPQTQTLVKNEKKERKKNEQKEPCWSVIEAHVGITAVIK